MRKGNYCSDTQGGTERGTEARHGLKDMLITSPPEKTDKTEREKMETKEMEDRPWRQRGREKGGEEARDC